MTHPPPDPEGRRQQETPMFELFPRCAKHPGNTGYQMRGDGTPVCSECWNEEWDARDAAATRLARLSLAARLDAALAGDPREAVERCWALVRELRGE